MNSEPCRECNKPFERPIRRGRPAVLCPSCKLIKDAVKQATGTTPGRVAPKCQKCGADIVRQGRGRRPSRCDTCRGIQNRPEPTKDATKDVVKPAKVEATKATDKLHFVPNDPDCKPCAHASVHGWWGQDHKGTHCRECHRSWTSKVEVHCHICHRHFSAGSVADACHASGGGCYDPDTLTRKDGVKRFVLTDRQSGPTWMGNNDSDYFDKMNKKAEV